MRIFLAILFSVLLSDPFEGYTLITNMGGGGQGGGGNQTRYSHLIDNNQNIINSWTHETAPASIAYLTKDSILYVPCKIQNGGGGQGGGPSGGRFKKMDWEGNIIWDYTLPTNVCIPHHDIAVLPNGNILAICSETKSQEEAINAGRENLDGSMTLDMIVEIRPEENNQATVVWEWHFWDHLIQDINPNLSNYGVLNEELGLLDINIQSGGGNQNQGINDWNHCNAISYNELFDQIVLSARHMNEIYVIDHSTTIEEASTNTGGIYGKGGDFLYRWGNPQNYNRGDNSDQILNAQHGINWIPEGYPGEGNFILFNNNHENNSSAVLEFIPPIDENGNYEVITGESFGPETYSWIHQSNFYSNTQSGAFRLPNGNTLITSTAEESVFEVSEFGNEEWVYEGELRTARAIKYPLDYLENNSLLGDVNNDQLVNVVDIINIVNMVLINDYQVNADLNEDGQINVIDIVTLVNIILEN
ncbi:MAG: arylsulfotransferase (ASST) [Candidatus Marinimicrobia bacterium]|nr:arylsulfotransferase (ASST) [Candidatus Neomarinimicrobiota bacterium]